MTSKPQPQSSKLEINGTHATSNPLAPITLLRVFEVITLAESWIISAGAIVITAGLWVCRRRATGTLAEASSSPDKKHLAYSSVIAS